MNPPDSHELALSAQRVRESQVLGRGGRLLRLFDFLVACAAEGRVPKEAEIAVDAFGRGGDFDGAQDATVRVYVHKLRRVLDDYYAGPGKADPCRLALPRGEYKLVCLSAPRPPEPEASSPAEVVEPVRASMPRRTVIAAAAVALGLVGVGGWWVRRRSPAEEEFARVRGSALWQPLLKDDRPIIIATGDYLLLGDTEGGINVRRLVREFDINSRADLAQHERSGRYVDLGLSYLPVSVAQAMRDVLPLLAMPNKRIRVLPMSQVSPDTFGLAHVVYVGLLSGMGRLRSAVLAGSGFVLGDTFDELVDTAPGGKHYIARGVEARGALHDFSYISAFDAPGGNRVIVVAGVRDLGLMQAGRVVGRAQSLLALEAALEAPVGFEALYGTVASSLDALPVPELVLARPRKAVRDVKGS